MGVSSSPVLQRYYRLLSRQKAGIILSIGVIYFTSLAGALVVSITLLGRTSLFSINKNWALLLLVSWLAFVLWAVLFSVVLKRSRGFSTECALYWASVCHVPLLLSLGLISVLYQDDAANHIFMRSPYGDVILRPMALLYLFAAPFVPQLLRLLIRDRASLLSTMLFLGIAGISTALRVNSIDWGLPARFHPDEYSSKALHMRNINDMNPHFFTNPTLMIYAIYFAQSAVWSLRDEFQLFTTFFAIPIDDPRNDYLLLVVGRIISALAGIFTVGVVYQTGKELLGRKVTIVAALILAVSLLHVRNSHFATNDVVAGFLLAASLLFCTRIVSRGSIWDYILAGVFGGLATTTKYTCVIFAIPLLAAHFSRSSSLNPADVVSQLWKPFVSVGLSLVAFFAVTPFSILSFQEFQNDVRFQYTLGSEPAPGQFDIPSSLMVLVTLAQGLGLLPLVFALAGSALLALRKPRLFLVLASVPIVFAVSFSGQKYFFARFLVPTLPFLSLLAGYGLVGLSKVWRRESQRQVVVLVLLVITLLQGVVTSVQFNLLLNQRDTRNLAADWIGAHTDPGADIGVEVHALMDNPYGWGPNCTDLRGPYWARYIEVFWPDRAKDLEKVISGKFDYIIVTSWGNELMLRHPDLSPSQMQQYRSLASLGTLAAKFGPGYDGEDVGYAADDQYSPFWHLFDRERPGPTVEIYQIKK